MKWEKLDVNNSLFCKSASTEDISTIQQKYEIFISSCKCKYPGVRRELEEALTYFTRQLSAGGGATPFLKLNSIRFLLRWSITDGNQLQDFRRDNARALWRALFQGPIPDFYRYRPQTDDYAEDERGRERWIETQITQCETNTIDE